MIVGVGVAPEKLFQPGRKYDRADDDPDQYGQNKKPHEKSLIVSRARARTMIVGKETTAHVARAPGP